jgi:hypothetical protein
MKNHGHTYKFHLNNYFLYGAFQYSDGGTFKVLRQMQNLH